MFLCTYRCAFVCRHMQIFLCALERQICYCWWDVTDSSNYNIGRWCESCTRVFIDSRVVLVQNPHQKGWKSWIRGRSGNGETDPGMWVVRRAGEINGCEKVWCWRINPKPYIWRFGGKNIVSCRFSHEPIHWWYVSPLHPHSYVSHFIPIYLFPPFAAFFPMIFPLYPHCSYGGANSLWTLIFLTIANEIKSLKSPLEVPAAQLGQETWWWWREIETIVFLSSDPIDALTMFHHSRVFP